MLKLNRINDEVYYNDIKLKINKQASKGPNNEVVYIKDCPEANGQTWISLSKLKDGINEIECKAKNVQIRAKYTLTSEEEAKIKELQSQIDTIIENAKNRYVEKPTLTIEQAEMLPKEEKAAYIVKVQRYVDSLTHANSLK